MNEELALIRKLALAVVPWIAMTAATAAPSAAASSQARPVSTFQLILIRKGPAWTAARTPLTDSLGHGHMKNIERMADAGKLAVAGPFLDNGDLRGLYVIRADSAAAARLAAADPAARAGRFRLEVHPMRAPADLGEAYRKKKKANPAMKDSMVAYTVGFVRRAPGSAGATQRHYEALADSGIVLVGSIPSGRDSLRALLVCACDPEHARRIIAGDAGSGTVVEVHPWMTAYGVLPHRSRH